MCDGILRARYRQGLDKPAMLEPGQGREFEIDLWVTSNLFRRAIASASRCRAATSRASTGTPTAASRWGRIRSCWPPTRPSSTTTSTLRTWCCRSSRGDTFSPTSSCPHPAGRSADGCFQTRRLTRLPAVGRFLRPSLSGGSALGAQQATPKRRNVPRLRQFLRGEFASRTTVCECHQRAQAIPPQMPDCAFACQN